MKKFRNTILLTGLAFTILSSSILASDGSKTIKAFYQNIKINVNNKEIVPTNEPFILSGTTFVPLRFVSDALDASVKWDGANNTITITKPVVDTEKVNRLNQELTQKNNELAVLKLKLENALEENSNKDTIDELEDELNDDYDKLERVEIDEITIKGDEDEITVTIEVDIDGTNKTEWNKLKNSEIKDWVEDLVDDIQDTLDDDTEVTGEFINTDEDDEIIEFEKDGKESLDISYDDSRSSDADVEEVEDDLDGDNYYILDNKFKVDEVDYDTNDDEITVTLYDASGNNIDTDDWDDFRESDLEDDIADICNDIAEEFEDEADVEAEIVKIKIYEDDSTNRLAIYEYDVDDEELD